MVTTTMQLRQATINDQSIIKQFVHDAELDPTSLHWSHFIVAEHEGAIVGIGQVRPYKNCRELGSLVVTEAFRNQGLGAQIIEALLAKETGAVYLECLQPMAGYYQKFGFEEIGWWQAPMPLRLKSLIGKMVVRLIGQKLIVMRRFPGAAN